MIDFEDTFIAAGGAPGTSETDAPLDDCLIINGYVLADDDTAGWVAPDFAMPATELAAA